MIQIKVYGAALVLRITMGNAAKIDWLVNNHVVISMKLSNILFENTNGIVNITGYHRNDNPEFKKEDITMSPRITRQSKRGQTYVGFYITMPEMNIDNVEELPNSITAPIEIGDSYGKYLYQINVSVPRQQILLSTDDYGFTRISQDELSELKKLGKKFVYVTVGVTSAEGIILDPSIITSVKKIEDY